MKLELFSLITILILRVSVLLVPEVDVTFFNVILHLIENKQAGLVASHKVFVEAKSLDKFNFDKNYWIPKFKHFGIEIVDTE